MFILPDTFKEDHEGYLVVASLKKFFNCRPQIKVKLSDSRKDLIKAFVEYANESESAEEDALKWIDGIAKEGIKDLYIKLLTKASCEYINDTETIYEKVESVLNDISVKHICNNAYSDELRLVRMQIEHNEELIYTFYFCQSVFVYDGKNEAKVRWYPICVELYPDKGLIIGRGKPRQNMFLYSGGEFDANIASKTNAEIKIEKAMQYVLNILQIECKSVFEIDGKFKKCLYNLLEKYTTTPPEIENLIKDNSGQIYNIIDIISKQVCIDANEEDIKSDILNLIEKYFSISYKDKTIFTKGREAYPLRIAATDEEESTVDQRSGLEHPLQSKAIFFDNKKMLQKNRMCDGITFKFKRKVPKYFGDEFKVKISAKNNFCHMKFSEYTEEVDIQNVLHLFIDS